MTDCDIEFVIIKVARVNTINLTKFQELMGCPF